MTDTGVQSVAAEVDQWLASFEEALTAGDSAAAARAVPRRQLLARPRRVHLEHQDRRGPGGRQGHARPRLAHTKPRGWTTVEPPAEADGHHRGVDRVRDRGRPRPRPPAAQGRQGVDAADHALRAQGPRGAAGRRPAAGRRARRRPGAADVARAARGARPSELGYETQPDVVIIGGGQGGIALGARLRQLGVPTIIVERNERPGDSWRKRYKSLCLHDPVWYDHLPYIKFPDNWPVFSPKDKIADWLEMYTRVMELNYWSSTDGQERDVRRGRRRVDGRRRARRRRDHAAAEAARAGDRHVGQAERARDPGHGRLQGRPAPLLRSTRAPTPTRARRRS